MNRNFIVPLAAAIAFAVPAKATTVSINPITASWGNVVGAGSTLNSTGNGTTTPEIRWGNDAGFGQSGYRYSAAATPLDVNVVVNGASSLFSLGQFTHFNNPIFAPSITGARLTINYGVSVGTTQVGSYNAVFDFRHQETPNSDNPCAFGGPNNQGPNINGCADRVTISLNSGLSEFFTLGGVNYTLDISGFFVPGVGSGNEFLTIERKDNTARLFGRIAAEGFTGQGVPEPNSWAMMLLGFGAVGVAARRRKPVIAA
jgi:hypothetical protein